MVAFEYIHVMVCLIPSSTVVFPVQLFCPLVVGVSLSSLVVRRRPQSMLALFCIHQKHDGAEKSSKTIQGQANGIIVGII